MLQPKTVLESILIRVTEAGQIQGIAAIDKTGIIDDATGAWIGATASSPAREIAVADLAEAAINPALAAQQATVADLTAQLATAKSDAQTAVAKAASDLAAAQAAAKTAQDEAAAKQNIIDTLQARIAALTAPAPESDVLSQLDAHFKSVLTPEQQTAFAAPWLLVRFAVQQGVPEMARAVIATTPVPDDLTAAKAALLALLTPAAGAP